MSSYVVACFGGRLLYETNAGFFAWNGSKLAPVTKWKVDYLYFHCETADAIFLAMADLFVRDGAFHAVRPSGTIVRFAP